MPEATETRVQSQDSIVRANLRILAQELLKGRDGAAMRMVCHLTLGLATDAEAKFARQYGWDAYRRY